MKKMTPNAICQLLLAAGHTIHIDDNAKTAPTRCVHVLPCSLIPQKGLSDKDELFVLSITGCKDSTNFEDYKIMYYKKYKSRLILSTLQPHFSLCVK